MSALQVPIQTNPRARETWAARSAEASPVSMMDVRLPTAISRLVPAAIPIPIAAPMRTLSGGGFRYSERIPAAQTSSCRQLETPAAMAAPAS
eukprot:05372_4